MNLKKVIGGWIASIFGILLGGFLLCFSATVPFAIVLMVVSGILFVCLGALALFINAGCL